jgi:hypothetical protein
MNKGDKVLCIKDCHYKDEKPYLEGVWYEIIQNFRYAVVIINYEIFQGLESSSQYNFFTIEHERQNKDFDSNIFQEHFITLAEWREKQINLILDEN